MLVLCFVFWCKYKINVIDVFGLGMFELESCVVVCVIDAVVMVVNVVFGVEVVTEWMWSYAESIKLLVMFCVNKMDCENFNFEGVLELLGKYFG